MGNLQVSAHGRIEGGHETISVGAAVDGVITEVLVAEGDLVSGGAVLARIGCEDISEERHIAVSERAIAEAAFARLTRGGRDEDIRAAEAMLDAATARHTLALRQMARARVLFENEFIISRAEFDQAESSVAATAAELAFARQKLDASRLVPLPEELDRAKAELSRATARITVLDRRLAKCNVVAPIDGRVVRVLLHAGERASSWVGPPVIQLSKDGETRVRAEIDEADALSVHLGQQVRIEVPRTVHRFRGEVVELAPRMGRREVRSDDPAERNDRDVREVVVRLSNVPEGMLPIGLRVVCIFERQ
jgi:HlyD family secretion protein